jgi:hypothetical protein
VAGIGGEGDEGLARLLRGQRRAGSFQERGAWLAAASAISR